ncbi:MAG: LamG-like jellyroll fold domain-containing protein [Sedimentisphaerales bacterium]|nr:LamG-like jellyroll fold domain-containing protein [Sedimentisphaerales bacterium]
MSDLKTKTGKKGAALLIVLFIIMVITISSIGFLSQSDVELACGRNMALRIQMDYLAESGIEHAKGLILNPQEISSEYWTGATNQQLVAGNDYYDVAVVRDDSDPTNRCNYIIDCNSYRLSNGDKIGRSNIRAELRLDPCIAVWTGSDTAVWSGVAINGDVYCNGTLTNKGAINGDVFVNALSGNITGRQKAVGDLSLTWPRVTVADFTSNYTTQTISPSSLSGQTFGPYSPVRVCHRSGNLTLAGNVQIEGMLIVDGNLTVQESSNIITAAKNLPALLVTGDLIVGNGGNLEINGLAVINGGMQVSADAGGTNILGGLFIKGALVETTEDSTGNGYFGTVIDATWVAGKTGNALDFDGANDFVKIVADPSLDNLPAITMSAWIYPRGGLMQVLDKGDRIKEFYAHGESKGLYGRTRYDFTHAFSESDYNTIGLNTWQHVALTWSQATNTRLFHNGTEVLYITQDTGSSVSADDSSYPFMIGARGSLEASSFFFGMIDEVHIYNRVLDANDITLDANGVVLSGLVGNWKLDEPGSSVTVTAAPSKTAIVVWDAMGIEEKWGQAAGAFFKRIQRQ